MTLLDEVVGLQSLLGDVSTLAQRDLSLVWRSVADSDVRSASGMLLSAAPEIATQYSTVSAVATSEFYDDLLPGSAFRAAPALPPPREQVEASTRWALGAMYRDSVTTPFDLLAGSLQRMVFNSSRQTIVENSRREGESSWARYASANACKFCAMVATRGDAYTSRRSAEGSGGGYHDGCRCMAVPVRPGMKYEPPSYVAQWESEYKAAAAASDGSTNSILSEWRKAAK